MDSSTVLLISFLGYPIFILAVIVNIIISKIIYKGDEKCAA